MYFPQEDILFLKRWASDQGVSMAEYIRLIVKEHWKEKCEKKPKINAAKSLLEFARKHKWKSKFTDLAKNHDKYLYGSKRIK